MKRQKKIKEKAGNAKVVFIGPCIAKKYEALTDEVTGYIDHVLTFEELAALFVAFGIKLSLIETETAVHDASGLGRGYAVAGGVGGAIMKTADDKYGTMGLRFERADTLSRVRRIRVTNNVDTGLFCRHVVAVRCNRLGRLPEIGDGISVKT